ncbi:MAG: transcriptional regulator NrdR [Endomicrobium sp.]|jgi:transcriptional repressor NrdR|nr:transcriptional regulator NrdR [Endomicrobium sp.]
MKCPFCGSFEDQVLDSRPIEHLSAVRRRRECSACKKRYTTFERPEEISLMVVKSDQSRQPFDRKKIWDGIDRACRKRPISVETIDRIVSEIENELTGEYVMEIPSSVIGQKILDKLWDIDLVAYIRFASVYRKFGDIETFMAELKKLKKENIKRQLKVKK